MQAVLGVLLVYKIITPNWHFFYSDELSRECVRDEGKVRWYAKVSSTAEWKRVGKSMSWKNVIEYANTLASGNSSENIAFVQLRFAHGNVAQTSEFVYLLDSERSLTPHHPLLCVYVLVCVFFLWLT